MKTARILAIAACLLGFCFDAADAVDPKKRLVVAGVPLHIGMTLEEAVDRFKGTRYKLLPLEGTREVYAISARGGPPFESPGNLTFRRGKLWWIGKSWGNYFGPDSASLFNALYGILASGAKDTHDAKIIVVETREPGMVRHEVKLELADGRTISLSLSDMQRVTQNVSILEMLGGRR